MMSQDITGSITYTF